MLAAPAHLDTDASLGFNIHGEAPTVVPVHKGKQSPRRHANKDAVCMCMQYWENATGKGMLCGINGRETVLDATHGFPRQTPSPRQHAVSTATVAR